jgi:hypothetical protein
VIYTIQLRIFIFSSIEPWPTCVNLAGKVERRKSAGKGCAELVLTMTYFT